MGWQTVVATVFQAGNRIVLNRSGLFIYNGAPAHGNLIVSATFASGTDSFGNTYFAGVNAYGQSSVGRGFVNASVDQSSGDAQVTIQPGSALAANLGSSPGLNAAVLFPGTSVERQNIVLSSGTEIGARTSSIQLNSESFDLTVFPAITVTTDSVTTNGLSAPTYFFNPINALSLSNLPNFMATVSNAGAANEVVTFALDSGRENSHDDAYGIFMAQAADSSSPGQIQLGIGSSPNLVKITKAGTALGNPVTATAGSQSTPTLITTDSWHRVPAFSNGWVGSGACINGMIYRLNIDNELEIMLDIQNPGAVVNSTVVTFTGSFVPTIPINHQVGGNLAGILWVTLDASGNLNMIGTNTPNKEIVGRLKFPLGTLP